jgi:hypothetical protein
MRLSPDHDGPSVELAWIERKMKSDDHYALRESHYYFPNKKTTLSSGFLEFLWIFVRVQGATFLL